MYVRACEAFTSSWGAETEQSGWDLPGMGLHGVLGATLEVS